MPSPYEIVSDFCFPALSTENPGTHLVPDAISDCPPVNSSVPDSLCSAFPATVTTAIHRTLHKNTKYKTATDYISESIYSYFPNHN